MNLSKLPYIRAALGDSNSDHWTTFGGYTWVRPGGLSNEAWLEFTGDITSNVFCRPDDNNYMVCVCRNDEMLQEIDEALGSKDDWVWEELLSDQLYNEYINADVWPVDCIEKQIQYYESAVIKGANEIIAQSPEAQAREAAIARRMEARIKAQEERKAAREARRNRIRNQRRNENSMARALKIPDTCAQDDELCQRRLRLKQARNCEGDYEYYWNHRNPGKHCCQGGKFYLQHKVFMATEQSRDDDSNPWNSNRINKEWKGSAQGASYTGIEALMGQDEADEIENSLSEEIQSHYAAVCHAGKIQSFDAKKEARCNRVKTSVISKIKNYNEHMNHQGTIEIWDHQDKNPSKLYFWDEENSQLVKKALTLVCPEGWHFEDSKKRYVDWTCGAGLGPELAPKAIFPVCVRNNESTLVDNSLSIFQNMQSTLGEIDPEEAHSFGNIDPEELMEFMLQADPDLAAELQLEALASSSSDYEDDTFNINARILGGTRVPTNDDPMYPWQVFIDMGNRGFCGGVVVSENVFLTAAHCIEAGLLEDPARRQVTQAYAGITHKNERSESNRYQLVHCESHTEYRHASQIMQNDIAFCTVGRNFDFASGKVAPACLPDSGHATKTFKSDNCYATGFGTLGKLQFSGFKKFRI